jgi:hypothetical protein
VKTEKDFKASVEVLRHNLNGFHSGTEECYRPVAVELRKLLCDNRKSLLPRARPEIKLHKLHWTEVLENSPTLAKGLTSIMPGKLISINGIGSFELTFARPEIEMEVQNWIEQPFFNIKITVKEIIKSVGDKEGAHSDKEYNDTLLFARTIKYIDKESHVAGIIGIGKYLSALFEEHGI